MAHEFDSVMNIGDEDVDDVVTEVAEPRKRKRAAPDEVVDLAAADEDEDGEAEAFGKQTLPEEPAGMLPCQGVCPFCCSYRVC
jgi:hypothetical protein